MGQKGFVYCRVMTFFSAGSNTEPSCPIVYEGVQISRPQPENPKPSCNISPVCRLSPASRGIELVISLSPLMVNATRPYARDGVFESRHISVPSFAESVITPRFTLRTLSTSPEQTTDDKRTLASDGFALGS